MKRSLLPRPPSSLAQSGGLTPWLCEKPDKNQLVLFECRKTYGKGYSVNFGENYELMKRVVVGWAYIIDLLPCGKEETK